MGFLQSLLLVAGPAEEALAIAAFGGSVSCSVLPLPGLVSRKKDVLFFLHFVCILLFLKLVWHWLSVCSTDLKTTARWLAGIIWLICISHRSWDVVITTLSASGSPSEWRRVWQRDNGGTCSFFNFYNSLLWRWMPCLHVRVFVNSVHRSWLYCEASSKSATFGEAVV